MWNKERDVFRVQTSVFQDFARDVGHRANRNLEELIAFHFEEVVTGRECLGAGWSSRATPRREKLLQISPVRSDFRPYTHRILRLPAANHAISNRQPIKKTGAGRD